MMKKSFLLCLLSLFFLFCNQSVYAADTINNNNKQQRQLNDNINNNETVVCIDLADFYYEIVLSVTSFPDQGDCNDQEDAEIAALLQKTINSELQAIPGTIKTQNRVCSDPINDHRRRLLTTSPGTLSFDDHNHQMNFNTTASQRHNVQQRILNFIRHGSRSYIYVGGGRCRFCFYDNSDHRRVLLPSHLNHRKLLNILKRKPKKPFPKVADILLCKRNMISSVSLSENRKRQSKLAFWKTVEWINLKNTTLQQQHIIPKAEDDSASIQVVGPYVPGDTFGVHLNPTHFMQERIKDAKADYRNRLGNNTEFVELPVKEGAIRFRLYALDYLPTEFTTNPLLNDDPLVVFINGIKLDFKLLLSQPGTTKRITSKRGAPVEEIRGTSFAGIQWRITKWTNLKDNFANGPQPDRMYTFSITAPFIVFAHKNQLDIDFLIKPNGAKAKQYAIKNLRVRFHGARCEVTGIEDSPFQEFQSVVESRLFHKLGLDLANEFQNKQGHCLQDKLPVVNVHLVQKESWKESKPRCG